MKVGDKVIVDPRLHECIWCIPMEEVKGTLFLAIHERRQHEERR